MIMKAVEDIEVSVPMMMSNVSGLALSKLRFPLDEYRSYLRAPKGNQDCFNGENTNTRSTSDDVTGHSRTYRSR